MSFAEPAAETEAKQILAALEKHSEKVAALTDAVNGLGANVQWIIENVQGIFQMFASPQFMSMLPNMMQGGMPDDGQSESGPATAG